MADERLSAACLWNQHLARKMEINARSERGEMKKKRNVNFMQERMYVFSRNVQLKSCLISPPLNDTIARCVHR